ncbi:amidase family protein [Mesorhizobium escarrei]|uniref:Indoleacetamide hydrolase n=1 Tax=Mesorhizobium escarrei TaxID=666018 RepID=A0ABM9EBI5_9HYPH|nr:amidase family protein [Mesorhizobium escarrei]CAH2406135.1 Amidase [Mesorhizobium escarrei]
MPLQSPEIDDLVEAASKLDIHLTTTEARIFTDRFKKQVGDMEDFLELRIEEHRPPLRHFDRNTGYRPTADEDPLNIFIRKCLVTGGEGGLLAGRKIGLKDHIAVAGVPMTLGSHFMDGYTPDFDATVVTRLLDAGATIIGKMNMEDFSFGGPGVAGVGDFGRPLNPHNHDYVTGGSSSGCAAGIASGQLDIAFGGDQGGSIRIPSSWSGCVGLMPTHGLVPHSGVFGLEQSIDYVGPMTRTVDDLALVLQCVAGADDYDPRQSRVPAKLPDYVGALGKDVKGLRIGILNEGFDLPGAEEDVESAVRQAIAVLEGLGAQVTKVSVPVHRTVPLVLAPIFLEGARTGFDTNFYNAFGKSFYPASFMAAFGRAKHSHSHEIPLNFKLILLAGTYAHERTNGRLYAKAQGARPPIVAQYQRAFRDVDLLVMPTCPTKSHPYVTPTDFADAIDHTLFGGGLGKNVAKLGANTCPFNITGFPSLSIPCGKSEGLPIGMQLVAPHFREDLLIQAAHAYQRSVDWDSFYP